MSKSTEELLRELQAGGVLEGSKAVAPAGAEDRETRPPGMRRRWGALFLIGAIILAAVAGSLPGATYIVYPFSLFVTLLHETGHALATVITGGTVNQLQLSSDLSGVTRFSGGIRGLIAPAGYLGATLAGVGIVLTPLRYSRWLLGVMALVPLAALTVFHASDAFTVVWSILFATALIVSAWKLPGRAASFLQLFIGVEVGLNSFRDLSALLTISESSSHIYTDAKAMSQALFGPPIFWAFSWTIISAILLAAALVMFTKRELKGS